ncbi:MAG: hypothetical protein AABZ74_05305, partial [Cyanobacteriota bacterium]
GVGDCSSQGLCSPYCEPKNQPKVENLCNSKNGVFKFVTAYDDRVGPDVTLIFAPQNASSVNTDAYRYASTHVTEQGIKIKTVGYDKNGAEVQTETALNNSTKSGYDLIDDTSRKVDGNPGDNASFFFNPNNLITHAGSGDPKYVNKDFDKVVLPPLANYYNGNLGADGNLRSVAISLNLRDAWNKYKCGDKNNKKATKFKTSIKIGDLSSKNKNAVVE